MLLEARLEVLLSTTLSSGELVSGEVLGTAQCLWICLREMLVEEEVP